MPLLREREVVGRNGKKTKKKQTIYVIPWNSFATCRDYFGSQADAFPDWLLRALEVGNLPPTSWDQSRPARQPGEEPAPTPLSAQQAKV